jgi:arsenate reductase-like glutaredoxin family protein
VNIKNKPVTLAEIARLLKNTRDGFKTLLKNKM